MKKIAIILLTALAGLIPVTAEDMNTETVIVVTIDGLRWQEVFNGADPAFFDQADYIAHKKNHTEFKLQYGGATPEVRREALMPFFWSTLLKDGQLYGNRDKGSIGHVTNRYHFSYPGYSEILTGIADDERIISNDKVQNPNQTLPEFLLQKPENKGKVEAFGSWDVFPYILNEKRSHVPVNAGFEPYNDSEDSHVAFLNDLQAKVPSPWDTVRLDAFTMGYARAALKEKKMRFVYIALGETDDFAHDGHYDQYVKATHRTDQAIADLWAWLQNDPRYAGKTTLLITTDHGRGSTSLEAWKYHGRFPYKKEDGTEAISDFPGDDAIWMATIGPDTPASGEIAGGPEVTLSQVAATAAKFLGYTYESDHPSLKAGKPVQTMFRENAR